PPASPPAARAGEKSPPADRFGDPLPAAAVARIGTTRFRHGDYIHSVAFTADGKRIVSYGDDGVRAWDAATGRQLRHLPAPAGGRFLWAACSADGELVATTQAAEGGALQEAPITVWDLASGKKVKELGKAPYWGVCFAPAGHLLAASRFDQVVETWDVAAGKRRASWQAHQGHNRAPSFAFTGDGTTLMTAGPDAAVRFWDAATGKRLRGFDGVVNTTGSVALSRDGKLIASVEHEPSPPRVIGGETPLSRVRVLGAADGKVLRQVELPAGKLPGGQANAVRHVELSPDGKTLAGVGSDGHVYLWDVGTGKESGRAAAFAPTVAAFSPDGKTLAVATWGHAIQLHEVPGGKERPPAAGLRQPARSAGLTPDGKTLVTSDGASSVALWDPTTGELRRRLDGHEGLLTGVLLAGDGRTLFSAGADGTVRAWDVATGRQLRRFAGDGFGPWPGLLACSPDAKLLAVRALVGADAPVEVIDTATGKSAGRVPVGALSVNGAAFRADGRSLVLRTSDGKARTWDVATNKEIRQIEFADGAGPRPGAPIPVAMAAPRRAPRYAVAVSRDGRLIAFGGENDAIAVHDLATGAELCRLEKLSWRAAGWDAGCLAFSPDGRALACGGGADGAVHVLEVATGKERRAFTGHRGGVVSLTFSADGRTLVSGGADTTLLVWDLTRRGARGGAAPSGDESAALWRDLFGDDAPRADRAVRRLAASPESAVRLFRERIEPVTPADEGRVAGLIADLDSDDFSTREKAAGGLAMLGDRAAGACRKALAGRPGAEVRRRLEALLEEQDRKARKPSAERVRLLRALEVLELAPTDEARRLLAEWAKGAPGAWLTEEAGLALDRLRRREPAR
ncbi:MAG TPA: WD40 repeat domain-containing protein, partial [Gemmataceae bacterium]|nr:WD40 repeat domain-containing protein [Gemmataceae bacterium]